MNGSQYGKVPVGVVCVSTARWSSQSSLQGSMGSTICVALLPTAMGNSKKRAPTASKASKASKKNLQVKKNQAVFSVATVKTAVFENLAIINANNYVKF